MIECVFCAIAVGSAPASIVYEDEEVLAIIPLRPINTGHVLVMPKAHAPLLGDLDEATGAHLFAVAMRIADAIRRSGVACEGINLFLADGEAAFQEIPHTHLHVFPRFRGDGFGISVDWPAQPTRDGLDGVAAQIRRQLPQS